MKKLLALTILFSMNLMAADTGLNPDYLKLKVYKVAISKSEYCTDLHVVFSKSNAEADYEDFLVAPTIGSGSVPVGTYKCVVIEFEDVIEFASLENSDSGSCVAGVLQQNQICRADQPDLIQFIDGSTSVCSNSAQRTTMWLSTASTNPSDSGGSAFIPPHAGNLNLGLPLLSPLVVSQGSTAKFIVNALGRIRDQGASCEMQEPFFSFENL